MKPLEIELLFDSDLRALREALLQESPRACRITMAPILRKWFLQEQLLRAIEKQKNCACVLACPNTNHRLQGLARRSNDIGLAAHVRIWGVPFGGFGFQNLRGTGEKANARTGQTPAGNFIWLDIEGFLNQDVIAHGSKLMKRREVISFAANKLGGVHFDQNGWNDSEKIIALASKQFVYHKDDNGVRIGVRFDPDPDGFMKRESDGVFDPVSLELTSSATILCNHKFIERSALKRTKGTEVF
jgi:hypothetical protein